MKFDVLGIGNALLDSTLNINETILTELNLKKGTFRLLEIEQLNIILNQIKNFQITTLPGGSTANVLAGINAMGGKTVFLGKIGNDKFGQIFINDTKKIGTNTNHISIHKSKKTGNALTFITSDGERTFAVYLGASLDFGENDLKEELIKQSKILHIEAYKIEDCKNNNTIINAAKIAKKHGTKISVDLSDSELIKRNFNYLNYFIDKFADIVFANEDEAEAFTGKTEMNALNKLKKSCDIAIVKLGKKGSLIKTNNQIIKINPHKTKVINTNGAGDMYAAGILFSLTNNIPIEKAGKIASKVASLVVAEESARVNYSLKNIINQFIL